MENAGNQNPSSRKNFWRKVAGAGLGAMLALGSHADANITAELAPFRVSAEMPSDVLTAEQLQAAHIRINHTPETQLHLRQAALNVPLFRDAASGKIDEVVITLTPETISPHTVSQLPKDVKLMYKGLVQPHLSKMVKDDNKFTNPEKEFIQKHLDGMFDGNIDWNKEIQHAITDKEKQFLSKMETTINLTSKAGFAGIFLSGRRLEEENPTFAKEHPELTNKAYILLDVGGKRKPNPKQSYPQPSWFSTNLENFFDSETYKYNPNYPAPGYNLGHEGGHYDPETVGANEAQADTAAFNGLARALNLFRTTGNNRDFWAVFKNDLGITITKDPPKQEKLVAAT